MWPCISVCPLFVTSFRMSSWPAPTSTQTAFIPVTHPEEPAKGLCWNISMWASKLVCRTIFKQIFHQLWCQTSFSPYLISCHIFTSHYPAQSVSSHSHSDYHLVPKQNLSSLGLRKCLWIRESLSMSAFSSSDARTHPGNLSPEQSRMLFTGNFATKSITWGWIFFLYGQKPALQNHWHWFITAHIQKQNNYKSLALCLYIGEFQDVSWLHTSQNQFQD